MFSNQSVYNDRKHPSRVNITDWIPGNDPKDKPLLGPQDLDALPLEEITIAEELKILDTILFMSGNGI